MLEREVVIRWLEEGDAALLEYVGDDVFDGPLQPELTREFLADPRHHLVVALDGRHVVGFASGFHYLHPDKRPQLFVNEVGVAESHRRLGIGTKLMQALLGRARELGCEEAWVGTELDNRAARRLYASTGGEQEEPFVMITFPLKDQR